MADDDALVLAAVAAELSELGYQVLQARDGAEAVALFGREQARIRLVLLDLAMPVMGGEEAFTRIQAMAPEVPVLLATGYSFDADRQRLLEQGVRAILEKPFTGEELQGAISRCLQAQ